ncbi:MAG: LTA synthase family protein [Bryobacteraceae bacterium]
MIDSRKATQVARVAGCLMLLGSAVSLLAQEKTWQGVAIGAAAIAGAWLCSLALTRRSGAASIVVAGMLVLLSVGSAFKQAWLQQPLLATDFAYFTGDLAANLSILERYPMLTGRVAAGLALFAAMLGWALWFEAPIHLRSAPMRVPSRGGSMLAGVAVLAFAAPNAEPVQQSKFEAVVRPWFFLAERGNVLSRFVMSFRRLHVEAPPRNFASGVNEFAAFTPDPKPPAGYPDIILWHDESTFDPAMLSGCTAPECNVRMFRPDADTAASGLLRVHTFGGWSNSAEFALLTGMSHRVFGEGSIFAHFTLAPRVQRSLPLLLKKYGYRTVAVYPNQRNFLNAERAYRHYGFDEFYDIGDLGLPNDIWAITDRAMYGGMRRIVDEHRGGPLLIYVLTQYQHGPHDQRLSRLPEGFRSLKLPESLGPSARVSLSNYLYRISLSDAVIGDLETALIRGDRSRRRVFLHYGDHQPFLDGHMEKLAKRGLDDLPGAARDYVTSFSVKTNFAPVVKESHPFVDISLLAGLLLDVAGIPKDEYFSANAKLRAKCDGGYLDCGKQDVVARYHDYVFHDLRVFE